MKNIISSTHSIEKSYLYGLFLVVLGNILLSFDSLLVRLANVEVWITSFWFGVLSFISMLLFLKFGRKKTVSIKIKDNKKELIFAALLVSISVLFNILAIKATTVSNVAVIMSSSPVFTALFSWILFKEKTRVKTLVAVAITTIGILIVIFGSVNTGLQSNGMLGNLFAMISTISFSLLFVYFRMNKEISKELSLAFGGLIVAGISILVVNPFNIPMQSMIILIAMGLFTAPIGRLLTASATEYVSATNITLFNPLMTILASLWAWLLLHEVPGMGTVIGGALIILTLLIYTLNMSKAGS